MNILFNIDSNKEIEIGKFEHLFDAIEFAEKQTKIMRFKVCEETKCLLGVRFLQDDGTVFWRNEVRVKKNKRGRDGRFFKRFLSLI